MVLTDNPIFSDWILTALFAFAKAAGVLAFVALALGFLVAAYRYGPVGGGDATYRMLRNAFRDFIAFSPRRIYALARLAVQESLRRHVWIALVIFGLILLFAGWFLDAKSNDPITLYLSFVLTATTYLVLLVALFLSAFSLPTDIKNHTIYTVVTKPVRADEIVLGRILGFGAIGTAMLAIMGVASYVFVNRGCTIPTKSKWPRSPRRPKAPRATAKAGRTSSTTTATRSWCIPTARAKRSSSSATITRSPPTPTATRRPTPWARRWASSKRECRNMPIR